MITSWDIYWITRLDGFAVFFIILGIVSLIVAGISAICAGIEEELAPYKRKIINFSVVGIVLIFISLFIPSTKEIVAIWVIPKMVNNENVQQIPENFAKLVNEKLKEWMQDIGAEEKGENK